MKLKFSFFLLCIFLPVLVYSQDYMPFKLKNTSMYINNRNEFQAIRIDSTIAHGQDTVFKNFASAVRSSNGFCKGSWVFSKIIKKKNGPSFLFKSDKDSLPFYFNGTLNQTWKMKTNSDKSYLQATVTTILPGTFLGISDSIKTINIVKLDSLGKNKTAYAEYSISKKNGLIIYIEGFEKDTLVGTSSPLLGIQNMTAKDIFDYAVGDEFLVENQNGYFTTGGANQQLLLTKTKVLSKRTSLMGDTIVYKDSVYTRFTSIVYEGSTPVITVSYDRYTKNYFIYLAGNGLNLLPWERQILVQGYWTSMHYDATTKSVVKNFDLYYGGKETQGCYGGLMAAGFPDQYHYYKGLGGGYYDYNTNSMGLDWNRLIYYKKGSVVWGKPISQGLLTGKHDVSANQVTISIFPNPISESAWFEIKGFSNATNLSFTLTDLVGKEVLHIETIENKFKIERGNLSPGLYLYSVKSNENVFKQGKIILQ